MYNPMQLETISHYRQDALLHEAELERLGRLLRSTTVADPTRTEPRTRTHRMGVLSHLWRPRALGHVG